ncbi:hypothetical protein [Halalkalibacterium ligniniphilum]|uniref:hypothetical protein n=1 Tax=Halalkalibacterium ligniniphilum TaxID=1134413 RepID=UPI00034875EA|nr:hypothetical protein [Halalkalibacterium ligniniphilum]
MLVHDLVETKQLLVGETKPEYLVVYEKFENCETKVDGRKVCSNELGTEEIVQILRGEGDHLLRNVESYCIGEAYPTLDAVLAKVKETHQEIFK